MKKILCFTIALIMLLGTVSVSAVTEEGNIYSNEFYQPYFDVLVEEMAIYNRLESWEIIWAEKYKELYRHYSSPDEASAPSATPDYIIIVPYPNEPTLPADICSVVGDYIVHAYAPERPINFRLAVYVPKDEKAYILADAYRLYPEEIDKGLAALVEDGYWQIGRRGDMDCNGKLDIKDVTIFQKKLAGLEKMYYNPKGIDAVLYSAMVDFNIDYITNVLDATAMQKKLAGLPFKEGKVYTRYNHYYVR